MAEPSKSAETEELLFSYAAGTLDEPARAKVESMLAADPALRSQLEWYEAICDGVVDSLPPLGDLPSEERILARTRPRKDISGAGTGFFSGWMKPAAAALIIAQAVAIGVLLNDRREEQGYRSVAPSAGKAVVFVIAFNPDTPEAKVRTLLLKAGATIVDGPKQMGDYRVAVPANKAQYAKQLFEGSGITEYVRTE
jgi:anti-sigma-K factor RskA